MHLTEADKAEFSALFPQMWIVPSKDGSRIYEGEFRFIGESDKWGTFEDAYPPLALKEIATNLLAHRDYEVAEPARINITPEKIVCDNPGGLTDHVRRQLQDREMQAVIQASARGIKGYRNPVIADFFFSAGAMDKEGSGLPDVVAEAANNLNALAFGPTADNSSFHVEIGVRPEALNVDPKTRTSRTMQREVRFSPNLLSVVSWPKQIWRIPATVPRGETRNLREAGAPPFFMHENAIWTFVAPADEDASAFLHFASNSANPSSHVTESILKSEFARGSLPRLLNAALERHLDGLSIARRFAADSIRAYFESDGTNSRTVSYRGLFKQATRTVVKPLLSRTTNTALFWEHKAVALRFEQFGHAWALALLPTYVFTKAGAGEWIDSQRRWQAWCLPWACLLGGFYCTSIQYAGVNPKIAEPRKCRSSCQPGRRA